MIWIIKKIYHIINKFLAETVIWTNHSVILQILKQIILSSSFINKLNFHLIWISQYCFQFEINIWYQFDQLNKVSDVLSWFFNWITEFQLFMQDDILDEVFIYNTTVIEMSLKFWNKIKKDYIENKHWKKIIKQFK